MTTKTGVQQIFSNTPLVTNNATRQPDFPLSTIFLPGISDSRWNCEKRLDSGRRAQRSERVRGLDQSANRVPEPRKVIQDYLEGASHPYRHLLRALSERLTPMSADCAVSVTIPCALHEESGYLYRALKSFTQQSVDPNTFELIVLGNFPKEISDSERREVKTTIAEYCRFRRDYPEVKAQLVTAAFDGASVANIGFMRGLLADLVLGRYLESGRVQDHLLLRCDADTCYVPANYIRNFLALSALRPNVDSFMGPFRWCLDESWLNPKVLVGLVLDEALTTAGRALSGEPQSGGPNFAVRASSYAASGGYCADRRQGEDLALTAALRELRQGALNQSPIHYTGSAVALETSARRAIRAILAGGTACGQWFDQGTQFSDRNRAVRSEGCQIPLVGSLEELSTAQLTEEISEIIPLTLEDAAYYVPGMTPRCQAFDKILGSFLNLSYEWEGDFGVKITGVEGLRARLLQIRDRRGR